MSLIIASIAGVPPFNEVTTPSSPRLPRAKAVEQETRAEARFPLSSKINQKNQLHFQSFYLHVLATVPSIKKPVLSLDDNITYPYVPFLETYLHFVKLAFPTSLKVGGPVGSHDLPGPLDVLSVVSSRISSSFKGGGVGWRCQMLVLSLLGLR